MGGARDDILHQLTIFLFAWVVRRSGQVDDHQGRVMWLGNYQFIEFNTGVHTTDIILMPAYTKDNVNTGKHKNGQDWKYDTLR